MSRRIVSFLTPQLAAALFVAGWLGYDSVLALVTVGISGSISSSGPSEVFMHRMSLPLSLALLGAVIGIGTLITRRFSETASYGLRFAILLVAGLGATIGMIYYTAHKLAQVSRYVHSISDMPDTAKVGWQLSVIPLHQIGIVASMVVVVLSIAFALFPGWRSE